MKDQNAFTLAEVLITLVVIGVVAAITIPVLNNKHQEQTFKSALKKNVAIFQQALDLYYANNGSYFIEENIDINNHNKFADYLKVEAVDDGLIENIEEKYHAIDEEDGRQLHMRGFLNLYEPDPEQSFRLINGADFYLTIREGIMFVIIDTNGINKGPNLYPKDLHVLPFLGLPGQANKLYMDEEVKTAPYFNKTYKMLYE